MTIDLSILYNGASSSSGTGSALAMYKKLQKQATENSTATASEDAAKAAAAQAREMNNAAIKARNLQYKQANAQIENDTLYFENRAATATTVDELVNDDRFLKVLAYANGFEAMYLNDRQKLRDILTSDLNDADSVARQGTLKDLELAKKYNFGTTGFLFDTDGNAVGLDADGAVTNDASLTTALPAGLAKLRGLAIDMNGAAILNEDATPASGSDIVAADKSAYNSKLTKSLLTEQSAPSETDETYAYDGEDYDRFTQRTDIQADIIYFQETIGTVTSVDDLFANQRLLGFILKAYDMESEAQYPGKMRKILESDLTDSDSLANRFSDPRFLELAQDLALSYNGVATLTSSSTVSDIVERYQQTQYEKHLDEQAPGVRVAIEFQRRLANVSTTVQLLGDSVLREVVTVANYIPAEMAYQETEAQVATVEKKVDFDELKNDPDLVEKMVLRYLSIKDGENSGASGGSGNSYLLNLLA